jgi:hypothetical protein
MANCSLTSQRSPFGDEAETVGHNAHVQEINLLEAFPVVLAHVAEVLQE